MKEGEYSQRVLWATEDGGVGRSGGDMVVRGKSIQDGREGGNEGFEEAHVDFLATSRREG